MSADDASRVNASLVAYRFLARGIAPPAGTWQEVASPSFGPPEESSVLLRREREANEALVKRLHERQAELSRRESARKTARRAALNRTPLPTSTPQPAMWRRYAKQAWAGE